MLRTSNLLLAVVALVFGALQLVPLDRDNPPIESDLSAPDAVKAILERSCYDCHSHETRWPWYGYVAPATFLVAYDVHEARDKMNFSTWRAYRPDERAEMVDDAFDEIDEGNMPPWYYLIMHPSARLSEADRELFASWVRTAGS